MMKERREESKMHGIVQYQKFYARRLPSWYQQRLRSLLQAYLSINRSFTPQRIWNTEQPRVRLGCSLRTHSIEFPPSMIFITRSGNCLLRIS